MPRRREKLVRRMTLEVFSHATESEDRVIEALERLLGVQIGDRLSKQVLHGYHGNPVLYMRYSSEGGDAQREVEHIISSLDRYDARELRESLDHRVVKGKLYLRLDKQDAYLGETRLSEQDDVVKVVITFYPHIRGREKILWALRKLGLRDGEET